MWNNNHVTTGYATNAPNEQLTLNGDFYNHPSSPVNTDPNTFIYHTGGSSTSGFYFENFYNDDYGNAASFFNEPILRPQFGMSMWLGNKDNQLYRVYSRRVYQSQGAGIWSFSDSRLKIKMMVRYPTTKLS